MNNQRRKELRSLADRLSEIKEEIGVLAEEEQEALDGLPENMQDGERGHG